MSSRKLIDAHKRRLRDYDAGNEVITVGGVGLAEAIVEHEAEKKTFVVTAVRGDGVIGKLTLPDMSFTPDAPGQQDAFRGIRGRFVVELGPDELERAKW